MLENTLSLIRRGITDGLHIGAQLYVRQGGQILADTALGQSRPGTEMSTQTLMLWQSASKPITAVAMGLLKDRGLIAWDDPISKTIPEFAQQGKETITIRHILTHTAGLRAVHLEWPSATWDQTIAALCTVRPEPRWTPGEKAGYHPSSSWFLLGEIIRRITGQSWDDFLRQEILQPLGMSQTLPAMTPQEFTQAQNASLGILHRMKDGLATNMLLDTQECCTNPRPPGGMHGPFRELGLFYHALLTNQTAAGQPLLSPQTLADLTTPQRVGMVDQTFRHVIDWGLGFISNSAKYGVETLPYGFGPHASSATFGHGGSQSCVGMADPARGLVVACLFNGCPGEAAHNQRINAFFKTLYEELP